MAILLQHLNLITQRPFPYHVETRESHILLAKIPVFRDIPINPLIGYAAERHLLNARHNYKFLLMFEFQWKTTQPC